MQNEIKKTYCMKTKNDNISSGSLLCNTCNKNQELKLNEMKKFEEKMDVNKKNFTYLF